MDIQAARSPRTDSLFNNNKLLSEPQMPLSIPGTTKDLIPMSYLSSPKVMNMATYFFGVPTLFNIHKGTQNEDIKETTSQDI
jgi:hypothetical protein